MKATAALLGRRSFTPVQISTFSYKLPRSGAFGTRLYAPHLFVRAAGGVSAADPDTKISGEPFLNKAAREDDAVAVADPAPQILPLKSEAAAAHPGPVTEPPTPPAASKTAEVAEPEVAHREAKKVVKRRRNKKNLQN